MITHPSEEQIPLLDPQEDLLLVWLAVLGLSLLYLSVKAALQSHRPAADAGFGRKPAGEKIERASVSFFRFFPATGFPQSGGGSGGGDEASRTPGARGIDSRAPEIDLISPGSPALELRVELHGLSAQAGTRKWR
jgi:hypothetical protein